MRASEFREIVVEVFDSWRIFGFEVGNVEYNEDKTGDLSLSCCLFKKKTPLKVCIDYIEYEDQGDLIGVLGCVIWCKIGQISKSIDVDKYLSSKKISTKNERFNVNEHSSYKVYEACNIYKKTIENFMMQVIAQKDWINGYEVSWV